MVDPAGNQSRLKLYGQCVPAVLEKLVKLDSETLNILGSRLGHNNNPGSSHNNPGKLVYILADKKGNSFYTYY